MRNCLCCIAAGRIAAWAKGSRALTLAQQAGLMARMTTIEKAMPQPLNQTAPAEITRPAAGKLVSGDPVHSTWPHFEKNGLYCGIWQSTPGAWRVQYDEWEYVNILSGHSILHGPDGSLTHLRAGDRYIIPQGFSGIWEVVETTVKDYVIQTFDP